MITSSNFFKKTFLVEEDDRNDWAPEKNYQSLEATPRQPRKFLVQRITKDRARKQAEQANTQEIFRKEQRKQILPTLSKDLYVGPLQRYEYRQAQQRSMRSYLQQLNFLKHHVGQRDRRLSGSLMLQRERLRWNAQSDVSSKLDPYRPKRKTPLKKSLDNPDIHSRDFMKVVQQKLNRIRHSHQ